MTVKTVNNDYSRVILEHYRKEAQIHGQDASSTMLDSITRGREVAAVQRLLDFIVGRDPSLSRTVDIGCGNGYLLGVLRNQFPKLALKGLEYTPEMCAVAEERKVPDCTIVQGDVRQLPFESGSLDIAITERCIINIMDRAEQAKSLLEVGRVLKPGGYFICIEAFTDGLSMLNEARDQLGLPPNQQPHHNIWFDKDWFLKTIDPAFSVVDLAAENDPSLPQPNFLSSHYFISRAFYPAITKREILYNTHFVDFFSFLPPMGNYSAVQIYLLKKK